MKNKLYAFYIILAASMWGATGYFVKKTADVFSAGDLVTMRLIGTAILLCLIFLLFDRSKFRIRLQDIWMFLGTGVCSVFLFSLCYYTCIQLCSVSVAVILLYTAPIFVVLFSAVLFHERFTAFKGVALLLTFGGCILVTGLGSGQEKVTVIGLLVGLGSGFFYALYSIFSRYALRRYTSFTITLYTFLCAALAALPFGDYPHIAAGLQVPGMPLMVFLLVVITTVCPYFFYTLGLSKVETGKASLLANAEPAVGILISVFIFHEPMTVWNVVGILLIFTALCLLIKTE